MSSPQSITRRFQLCTIEPAVDITETYKQVSGTLVLSRSEDVFQIHWTYLDGSPAQHYNAAAQSPSAFKGDPWKPNNPFKIDCTHLRLLKLSDNPLSITIESDERRKRQFSFDSQEFVSMTELVEQLIINGIAVPSPEDSYCLAFYKRCHRGVYPYTPPHIQLSVENESSLEKFWDSLHSFFQSLIIHLDQSDTLPKDPLFPLATAARASHARVMEEIRKYSENLETQETIKASEWDSLFDETGKLKEPQKFRTRAYFAGIESSILSKALPYVFGVYPIDSTESERNSLNQELEAEFNALYDQTTSFLPQQIENDHRKAAAFRVIKHDVSRTDRHLPAFKNKKAPGLKMVTKLLKTYCVFNPPIGYLQGMNDLFVPILLAFLPKWDEEGNPLNENGEIIQVNSYLPVIFWCFDAMLRNTNHLGLLADVTAQCQKQANQVYNILVKVSPLAAIWMRRNTLKELLWCYSDFVLLFKRSFSDIWSIWLQLNCSPHPGQWLTYFVAAIIVQGFDSLANLPDVGITTMMDAFPRILAGLKIHDVACTSLWLAEKVPPVDKNSQPSKQEVKEMQFKFFETEWTKKC